MERKATRILIASLAVLIGIVMAMPIGGLLGLIGHDDSVSPRGAAHIQGGGGGARSVDYLWYDMFNVPFGEWWNSRWVYYGTEQVMSNSYPYMFKHYEPPEGNVKVYANSRLNMTARNMTQISMGENPEFLPLHGAARGGTAVIDWYMQYLTSDEMKRYPSNTAGWLDGWVTSLNGTVTLDEEAALSVIKGLTSVSFDNFNTWWQTNGTDVSNDITGWLTSEAAGPRLNIYPAYEGTFLMLTGSIAGVKVDDKVVLTYDIVTWGMEAVMMRWLHEAFMPTEWWFEDMNFHAVIGPEMSTLDIDTAVAYALYAFDTIQEPRRSCWVFEGMYQDVLPSFPPDVPYSDIDVYLDSGAEYLNGAPGNAFYGNMVYYDYTPGAWNLSENETLTLSYPSGQLPFLVHVPPEPGDIYASTTSTNDTMSVKFSEPNSAENSEIAPGTVSVNNTARNVVFTGPIDMWDWANNQSSYDDLKDNWTRIDLLPHGVPWVELGMEHGLPRWAASFNLTGVQRMPVVNTPVTITVTVLDNYGQILSDYTGTVRFTSNRSDIDLPADYTFDPALDGGKHKFTDGITFHGLGYYQINMSAVGGNATGTYTDIWVIPEPEEVTDFQLSVLGVKGIVIKGLSTSVEVTVFNQYPSPHNVFKGYDGTAEFSTDAPAGTYTLPPNATFSPANKGMATLSGLLYNEMGTYTLTVTDQLNTSATESVTVVVSVQSEIDYRLYDMFEQPWGDWWPWRLMGYKTDIILSNKPHAYTMVYNPDARNLQGIIYAPYRWNVTAKNMTTVSVHDPEFMPILGTPDVPGAAADMQIRFQYLDNASWNGYWKPTWQTNWNWSPSVMDSMMAAQFLDGYYLGTLYTISLNREAALEWLGMPTSANPATWWTANRATYMSAWQRWITNEGNVRLDIWPAYEWPYIDLATMMDLVVETDGKLTMKIAHFNWGFEILTTRWLREVALCNHEPYMEDFNLSAHCGDDYANVTYDAVCQYNLHAVKANGTANAPAWVWEPQRIDYVAMDGSEFNPWEFRTYTSWNSGDGYFGTEVPYDFTPQWFNLTSYMTFEIQLPTQDNVIGYMGEKLPTGRTFGAIWELKRGSKSAYENITVHGPMELGYNMTELGPGVPNLWNYYDPVTKTLRMTGPIDFDNYRFWDGLLYHSAPWIEFDVSNGTPADFPPFADAGVDQSAGSGITVTFDGSGSFDLEGPLNYTWTFVYDGQPVMRWGVNPQWVFLIDGVYNVALTVRDSIGQTDSDTMTVTVTTIPEFPAITPQIDYRLYDMFEQPWGDWWPWRLVGYKTDIILSNKPHEYTMVYNPDARNLQSIIYAPYRWNVTAKNMTTLNVHTPEFMPILGTPDVPGAAADMRIWFQYLDNASWNGYWVPTWSGNWNWSHGVMDSMMAAQFLDGYYLGTLYTVSLNREAALEWLGIPLTDDPATWWTANRATYMSAWQRWITNEGNFRLDIWPAYEWPYVDLATMMDLGEETDGRLTLKIAHFNWGYEVLTTRWLREVAVCNHEPYYEDFNLSAHYGDDYANVTYDAVCQYNLHAVKANGTANAPAWVWEPQRIDYVAMDGSEFNPWEFRTYTSWSSGDGYFGTEVPYDFTPQWFNLTSNMTFEIQLPLQDNAIGYMGEKLTTGRTFGAIIELKKGNRSAYENITVHGPMELGYNMTGLQLGAPNLWDYYDPVTKTLKMTGPIDFDNYRHWDGYLYHSAPWIEFNVANVTWGNGDTLPFANAGIDQSAGSGITVTFDGSGSFDLEGPLNYTWTFVYDGQPVMRWGVNPQWVFLIDGVYNVALTVRDSIGQTDSDTMTVTVTTIPEFPAIGIPLLALAVGSIVLGFGSRKRRRRS